MNETKRKWYVGINGGRRFMFSSDAMPTEKSHGEMYAAVIGPFRTKRAAAFSASAAAYGNPHLQSVGDAERIVKSGF